MPRHKVVPTARKRATIIATDDEERALFLAALGRAVDSWQAVEMLLQKVFARLVTKDPDSVAAAAAYFAVFGFKARVDMTEYAARVTLPPKGYGVCGKLIKRCLEQSKDRNRIAHSFMQVGNGDRDGYRFHLCPMPLDPNFFEHYTKRLGVNPKRPREYHLKDLNDMAGRFTALAHDLFDFAATVKLGRMRRPPKLHRLRLPKRDDS